MRGDGVVGHDHRDAEVGAVVARQARGHDVGVPARDELPQRRPIAARRARSRAASRARRPRRPPAARRGSRSGRRRSADTVVKLQMQEPLPTLRSVHCARLPLDAPSPRARAAAGGRARIRRASRSSAARTRRAASTPRPAARLGTAGTLLMLGYMLAVAALVGRLARGTKLALDRRHRRPLGRVWRPGRARRRARHRRPDRRRLVAAAGLRRRRGRAARARAPQRPPQLPAPSAPRLVVRIEELVHGATRLVAAAARSHRPASRGTGLPAFACRPKGFALVRRTPQPRVIRRAIPRELSRSTP